MEKTVASVWAEMTRFLAPFTVIQKYPPAHATLLETTTYRFGNETHVYRTYTRLISLMPSTLHPTP